MSPTYDRDNLKLAIPKGRMYEGVTRLLDNAGLGIVSTARNYRPAIAQPGYEVKLLKPRAIVEMLGEGTRDLGFAGADWVVEGGADIVEILDTNLDRVRLVAAAPTGLCEEGRFPDRPIVVASEYANLARNWIESRKLNAKLLISYGATEVLPPEDADCIIDNTATGATLAANGLDIIDEIMTSSTRLYASRFALENPAKRERIEQFALLVGSVLEARRRVMLELNVSRDRLDAVVECLPCMREPTVAKLMSKEGFAVKVAVQKNELPALIPTIKALGGTDIVVTRPEQIVP
ncbi:MAG: ATP phosphoribosyltransferase [Phycisphaerales bacterium JB061]